MGHLFIDIGLTVDRRELQAAGRQDNKVLEIWRMTQEFSAGVYAGCRPEVDLL